MNSRRYPKTANTTIAMTSTELANPSYNLAYICSWVGNAWKCGCRDSACAQRYCCALRSFSEVGADTELCATKRNDVMGGKPQRLYRQALSPWDVASGGCKPEVKKLPLKGTREARCKPPRGGAWLRTHTVSKRRNERPTGKSAPVSRPCTMGQRPHPMIEALSKDGRSWLVVCTSPKDVRGQPELPSDRSGFREERIGSIISSHLSALVEYIVVNVGGSHMEMSSPSMKYASVGGLIVVRGRESRLQGEGGQGIDARRTISRRSPWESLVLLVK
jgi:hypothetical protein